MVQMPDGFMHKPQRAATMELLRQSPQYDESKRGTFIQDGGMVWWLLIPAASLIVVSLLGVLFH